MEHSKRCYIVQKSIAEEEPYLKIVVENEVLCTTQIPLPKYTLIYGSKVQVSICNVEFIPIPGGYVCKSIKKG